MPDLRAEFTVGPEHPCLAGHFPGRPIVPAVVLLDLGYAALADQCPELGALRAVASAKFLQPVLPGQAVTIQGRPCAGGVDFICATAAGTVAQGRFVTGGAA